MLNGDWRKIPDTYFRTLGAEDVARPPRNVAGLQAGVRRRCRTATGKRDRRVAGVGCGETGGRNECKGKGECGVPLKEETWKKVRAKFEEVAKVKNKTIGNAPAKKS